MERVSLCLQSLQLRLDLYAYILLKRIFRNTFEQNINVFLILVNFVENS